jgi:hypothetical protein
LDVRNQPASVYIVGMSTVAEIQAALPKLGNDELRQVEQAVRQLYRARNAGIIFDDAYGVWTEADQTSAAAEVFEMLDREEGRRDAAGTR